MKKLKLVINNDFNKIEKEQFFIKKELQCILNLYAKMVSNGSWRDYSFSSGAREVSFDVYLRASEKPVLRILKNFRPELVERTEPPIIVKIIKNKAKLSGISPILIPEVPILLKTLINTNERFKSLMK